jgi:hypothetical protein
MKCKFKDSSYENFCHVIHGECQFILNNYGEDCPIYWQFLKWQCNCMTEIVYKYLVGEIDDLIFESEVKKFKLIMEEGSI